MTSCDMVDIEYIISSSFRSLHDSIYIGGLGYDRLKDCDQDTFICDCITHEFIHTLLENMFNRNTSCLFDFIGDSLLNTRILERATCLTTGDMLWSEAVKENGVQYIYNEYMLDNIDLIQVYLICNTRGK